MDSSRQQRITAAFGWVRIIAATCSFFVVGIIYTDFDPGWLYDTFVSSAVNVGVAMGAAVAGMAVLLLVCPAKKRWSLCRAFASPLFTMVALVLGVAAAIGLAALLMHLEIWLFKWLFGRGLVFAVVAVVLYAPVAVVSTFKLLAYLGVQVVMIVNACLRHWFGCGKVHPMLPALATLAFAVAHMAIGAWETAARGADAVVPTDVQLTISVGGPACVVVLALVELRLLAAEGVRLDGRCAARKLGSGR